MCPESIILLVLLGGMLLLMVSRTRRQQREAQNLQSQLAVGSRIMTTAGLYATVVEVDGSAVVLETAPGQRSRWDRRAVARVLTDDDAAGPGEGSPEDAVEPADGAEERPAALAPSDAAADSDMTSQDAAPPERA